MHLLVGYIDDWEWQWCQASEITFEWCLSKSTRCQLSLAFISVFQIPLLGKLVCKDLVLIFLRFSPIKWSWADYAAAGRWFHSGVSVYFQLDQGTLPAAMLPGLLWKQMIICMDHSISMYSHLSPQPPKYDIHVLDPFSLASYKENMFFKVSSGNYLMCTCATLGRVGEGMWWIYSRTSSLRVSTKLSGATIARLGMHLISCASVCRFHSKRAHIVDRDLFGGYATFRCFACMYGMARMRHRWDERCAFWSSKDFGTKLLAQQSTPVGMVSGVFVGRIIPPCQIPDSNMRRKPCFIWIVSVGLVPGHSTVNPKYQKGTTLLPPLYLIHLRKVLSKSSKWCCWGVSWDISQSNRFVWGNARPW